MDEPIVRVEHLTKIFGPHPQRPLEMFRKGANRAEILEKTGHTLGVADVTFEVHKGEILVVMGLSGSGKSTLVRCLNRLIEPTAGSILLEGEEVTAMGREQLLDLRRHKMGMVFQRFALFPHRTVEQNAEYGLEVMGEPPARRRERAREVLSLVGLEGWEEHYPESLSGGMQQRVGLARAFAADPDIILMDEALSALDPLIRKDMQNEIIGIQRKLHKTIIFITHDLDEAINIGDRIILMKDGRIAQEGTAEKILSHPASDYVARFVEDVDISKVIPVRSIMKKVHEVIHLEDGRRVMLHKLRDAGLSTLFVTDNDGTLKGLIRAKTVADRAKEEGDERARDLLEPAQSVGLETPIQDVVPLMAERPDPVAVVDGQERIKGVVVLGTLLAGLAEGVSD